MNKRETDNDKAKWYKYVCITTNQPNSKPLSVSHCPLRLFLRFPVLHFRRLSSDGKKITLFLHGRWKICCRRADETSYQYARAGVGASPALPATNEMRPPYQLHICASLPQKSNGNY